MNSKLNDAILAAARELRAGGCSIRADQTTIRNGTVTRVENYDYFIEVVGKHVASLTEREEGDCIWTENSIDGLWATDCQGAFDLIAGTPKQNEMRFCPYCGRRLKEAGENGQAD